MHHPQIFALLSPEEAAAALTAKALANMTPEQIQSLPPALIAAFSSEQLAALQPEQLVGLSKEHLAKLSPQQLLAVTGGLAGKWNGSQNILNREQRPHPSRAASQRPCVFAPPWMFRDGTADRQVRSEAGRRCNSGC